MLIVTFYVNLPISINVIDSYNVDVFPHIFRDLPLDLCLTLLVKSRNMYSSMSSAFLTRDPFSS